MSNLKLSGSSFQLLDLIFLFSSWLKSWICFPHENTRPCNQVPSQSSFWWAKQIELSKSLTAGNFLPSSNHYCGYFLDSSVLQTLFSAVDTKTGHSFPAFSCTQIKTLCQRTSPTNPSAIASCWEVIFLSLCAVAPPYPFTVTLLKDTLFQCIG